MATPSKTASNFRVIIVGGGIAGLTLANTLQLAGVDYVLLERRSVIDPQVGASIGIFPNGSRILDQVDCYDDIRKVTTPIEKQYTHKIDGSLIGQVSDGPVLGGVRSAYEACFLDRQLVLGVLAKHVKDQSRILLNKRVLKIDHTADQATVICEDGSRYGGDIVIGADGVNSEVRKEMWRLAEAAGNGAKFQEDKTVMKAEYKCLFGISPFIDGMPIGDFDTTYAKDVSTLSIVGQNGRVFWFVFFKLDKTYYEPNIPRYTAEDAKKMVDQFSHVAIKENSKVTVKHLYDTRVTSALVALEEADFKNWHWGRLVCVGDSIHKMTPNLGAGGNSAIESCAALSNELNRLKDKYGRAKPPLDAIHASLEAYQAKRKTRIFETMKMANSVTRLQALKTTADYIIAHYVMPNAGDYLNDLNADFMVGAEILEYAPPPARSLEATMPFNPEQGWGYVESKAGRALRALPFLALTYYAWQQMAFDTLLPVATSAANLRQINSAGTTVSIFENFHPGLKMLDDFWRPTVACFLPSVLGLDQIGSWQAFSFLLDVTAVYAIWLIEGTRRSNNATMAMFPALFGFLFQRVTIGVTAPLYFFLLYIFSPIANFKATDHRLTDLSYTLTIIPTLTLFSAVPIILMYTSSSPDTRQYFTWGWQMFPVWTAIVQHLLSDTVVSRTMAYDRVYAPKRDVTAVRITAGAFGLLSAGAWVFTLLNSPFSLAEMLLPAPNSQISNTLISLASNLLRWDEVFMVASCLLWLMYAFHDLKQAGMMESSWVTITALGLLLTVCIGPGATFVAGWMVREELLIHKRHKGAVIKGRVSTRIANGSTNGHIEGKKQK